MEDNQTPSSNVFKTLIDLNNQKDYARQHTSEIVVPESYGSFSTKEYIEGFVTGWEAAYSDAMNRILLYFAEANK